LRVVSGGMVAGPQARLARLDIWRGEPEMAITRLEPLRDQLSMSYLEHGPLLWTLAWACLELGDLHSAQELANEAVAEARAADYPSALARGKWVQGMVADRCGRYQEGLDLLNEAINTVRLAHDPYDEGVFLRTIGEVHARIGNVDEGRRRLGAAQGIFQRLGAKKEIEWTERALAELDAR
jgi:tetratricopeptide (TPR) repeat protein